MEAGAVAAREGDGMKKRDIIRILREESERLSDDLPRSTVQAMYAAASRLSRYKLVRRPKP